MIKRSRLLLLLVLAVVAASCIPGSDSVPDPAGFFTGIWHGWIAPISLIVSFFRDSASIYETANSGWPYDLGFYMAVISGFGGISLFRRDKSKHRRDRKGRVVG
ncbi:MAG: hypothetical protein OEO77_08605 [Acidimicrobiia bacterium]|nr:hypothetical protein [Acidimicrobiia bacterium]